MNGVSKETAKAFIAKKLPGADIHTYLDFDGKVHAEVLNPAPYSVEHVYEQLGTLGVCETIVTQ